MTRIEQAVREVSDLRDFYRRIPKIKEKRGQATVEAPPKLAEATESGTQKGRE